MVTGSSPYGDVSWNNECRPKKRSIPRFVSLRRRELKYIVVTNLWINIYVRLLTETWVEMPNASYHVIVATWVRLLTETWVEMKHLCTTSNSLLRSSPYGDVSWNFRSVPRRKKITVRLLTETWVEISPLQWFLAYLSSSPYGDVSWNVNPNDAANSLYGSSPCGDVNWNSFCFFGANPPANVRLLTETWIEMLSCYKMISKCCGSSP